MTSSADPQNRDEDQNQPGSDPGTPLPRIQDPTAATIGRQPDRDGALTFRRSMPQRPAMPEPWTAETQRRYKEQEVQWERDCRVLELESQRDKLESDLAKANATIANFSADHARQHREAVDRIERIETSLVLRIETLRSQLTTTTTERDAARRRIREMTRPQTFLDLMNFGSSTVILFFSDLPSALLQMDVQKLSAPWLTLILGGAISLVAASIMIRRQVLTSEEDSEINAASPAPAIAAHQPEPVGQHRLLTNASPGETVRE